VTPVSPVIPGAEALEVTLGKGQPEYVPLPAIRLVGDEGELITRWELSDEDRARLAAGGSVYLHVWTFGQRLQPVRLSTEEPAIDVISPDGVRTVGGRS
jgi:hypothetical protein